MIINYSSWQGKPKKFEKFNIKSWKMTLIFVLTIAEKVNLGILLFVFLGSPKLKFYVQSFWVIKCNKYFQQLVWKLKYNSRILELYLILQTSRSHQPPVIINLEGDDWTVWTGPWWRASRPGPGRPACSRRGPASSARCQIGQQTRTLLVFRSQAGNQRPVVSCQ